MDTADRQSMSSSEADRDTADEAAVAYLAPRSSRPRLGFLGVGWIGRHRMEAVAASGVAEVAAVSDTVAELCDAAAAAAGGCEIVPSLDTLLTFDLDGVVIATPSALHAEQALAALDRGVAVFCQKPLGRTAGEVGQVVAGARRANRLLGVDLSYRHTEALRRVREVVRAGDIGEVFAADLVFHNAYGPDKPWFYDPALSGGGCLIDLGIHLVDAALWVLDFPPLESVSGRLFAGGVPLGARPERVEDYATARLDLASGASVQVACSWRLAAGRDAVISAAFYGTRGGVAMRNVGGSFYDFVAERYHGTSLETLVEPPDAWGGRAVVDWASRLALDPTFAPEAERLVTVAEALDRVYGR